MNQEREKESTPATSESNLLINKLTVLLERIFGQAATETGVILKNELAAFKIKRLMKFHEKLKPELEKRGLESVLTRELPFGLGSRIIEHICQEDDDEVIELWAKLVASSIDPDGKRINKAFVSVLSELSSVEAQILKFLWLRLNRGDTEFNSILDKEVHTYAREILDKYSLRDRAIAVENLIRQKCIRLSIDDYYLENIGIRSNLHIMSEGERSRGRAGGDALDDIRESIISIRRLLENLGGFRDASYLARTDNIHNEGKIIEVAYELSEFGIELMFRCGE